MASPDEPVAVTLTRGQWKKVQMAMLRDYGRESDREVWVIAEHLTGALP